MVHSPAREGIAKAVSGRLKTDHIDMLQNTSYDFDSAKQSAAAARQEQRLRQDAEASTAEQSTGLSANQQGKKPEDRTSPAEQSTGTSQNRPSVPERVVEYDKDNNRIPSDLLKRRWAIAKVIPYIKGHNWPEEHEDFFEQYGIEYLTGSRVMYAAMDKYFSEWWSLHSRQSCYDHKARKEKKKGKGKGKGK